MKFIRRLKALGRKIKANRKLKKSGCKNWRSYKHNHDDSINRYATYIDDFYHGYPYVYVIQDYKHYAYQLLYDYGPGGHRYGFHDIEDWCSEKIRWDYRVDLHRVWVGQSGRAELNEIGGGDILHFAFKREQDFTHFMLRWS